MKTLYAYSGPEEIGWVRHDNGEWSYEITHYLPELFEQIETEFSRFVADPIEELPFGTAHSVNLPDPVILDDLDTTDLTVDDQLEFLAAKAETYGASHTEVIES
jgi:hypothetical protein